VVLISGGMRIEEGGWQGSAGGGTGSSLIAMVGDDNKQLATASSMLCYG
jgi:hypothetical protein